MSIFSFSKIAIIESLDPGEFKSGTHLGKYIEGLKVDFPGVPDAELTEVTGRVEFLKVLQALTDDAENGRGTPILQIEMHGWDDKTGLAFPDDTSLSWAELGSALATLNKATRFNLLVCVSACFGGHFIEALLPSGPSPCFAMIGPTNSVSPSELLGSFRSLYRQLLTTLDANTALSALLAHRLDEGGFVTATAEDWFFRLADGYLRTHCTPERLAERGSAIIEEFHEKGALLGPELQLKISQLGEELAF